MFKDKIVEIKDFIYGIINKMYAENIIPTPENYKIFFFNEIEKADKNLKKSINSILSISDLSSNDVTNNIEKEKSIKQINYLNKEILKDIKSFIKQTEFLKNFFLAYKKRIKQNKNISKDIVFLERNINKIISQIDAVTARINQKTEKIENITKNIEYNSVFNVNYDVYNKNFFMEILKKELQIIKIFNHKDVILILEIKNEYILSNKNKYKEFIILKKSIVKILQKSLRKTDIISDFDDKCFAILLKHTNFENGKKVAKKISDIMDNSSIFINNKEIKVKIGIEIFEINSQTKEEELFKFFEKKEKI